MKMVRLVSCFVLLCLLATVPASVVLAQEPVPISEEPQEKPAEKIEFDVPYPAVESIAGGNFEFEVEFKYTGEEARDFELNAIAPRGWEVYMTPKYEKEKKIKSIKIKPTATPSEPVRVVASAPFWPLPDPGEYQITFEATSGNITGSTKLTAAVTAKYVMQLKPVTERYNTKATAGEDNSYQVEVVNASTAPVDNIKFEAVKPDGWEVEFTPEKIESLPAFDKQTVDVNIKPSAKTIAGDYMINLSARGEQTSAKEIDVRVTVETPTIWGWVGVIIIVIVVAGLVVIFMRFSRR